MILMSQNENPSRLPGAEPLLDEAETLIWALLDEHLDKADADRLLKMIEENAAVRTRYIECVQLHVDLKEHFGRQEAAKAKGPVVLPNLLAGLPGLEGFPQIVD